MVRMTRMVALEDEHRMVEWEMRASFSQRPKKSCQRISSLSLEESVLVNWKGVSHNNLLYHKDRKYEGAKDQQ